MAITLISLTFLAVDLGLLNSHSFGGCTRTGASAAMRHDELIGNWVEIVMAALPDRKNRNLA
jgi:hypothetical protein